VPAVAVALSDAGTNSSIAKLVPLADGGCSLIPAFSPSPHPGWLLVEVPVDYSVAGVMRAPRENLFAGYRSDFPVKLSLHGSGLVQFSRVGAQGVLSGRDPVSRAPRALGYDSFPITDPPRTGPMFGRTAWGLSAYPAVQRNRAAVVAQDADVWDQDPDTSKPGNAYAFEFWPLPRWALPHARVAGGHLILIADADPILLRDHFPQEAQDPAIGAAFRMRYVRRGGGARRRRRVSPCHIS
jgi:hypothetical protein